MNKRQHERKKHMARKMRSRLEMSHHTVYLDKDGNPIRATYANIFDTRAWLERKIYIAERVRRQQARAHARALERKAKKHGATATALLSS